MRFEFVTYRWGADLVGGAEIHHRRLAEELLDLGHEVSVLTTSGHEIRPFCHWGVMWKDMTIDPGEPSKHIKISRRRMAKRPRVLMAMDVKRLQARIEAEEAAFPAPLRERLCHVIEPDRIHLLNGWHFPEGSGQKVSRWTQRDAWFVVKHSYDTSSIITVVGHAPKRSTAQIFDLSGRKLGEDSLQPGHFELKFTVPAARETILRLCCNIIWHPWRDFRGLGLRVERLFARSESGLEVEADLREDMRSLGRAVPDEWQAYLLDRAKSRGRRYGVLMDRLRGPQASGDWPPRREDGRIRIVCNMPWATMSTVMKNDLAMPLWHIEDEFYYWQHWIDALRRARLVLANTPYTAESFFPGLGIRAHFVGPPIWEPECAVSGGEREEFRREHSIRGDEVLVLTVCRKSGEKRYEAVAQSVARLRGAGVALRMLGIGPDHDGRTFAHDGCAWLGQMAGDALQRAYAACDVFCLMSESESFGMVIPEAWHHSRPVVVNRRCGPAASLVSDGVDGLLAEPGPRLDDALRALAESATLRRELGEAGRRRALRDFVRGAAARRLMAGLESHPPG